MRRVVITGSVASLLQPRPAPYVYSAADWCDFSVEHVESLGRKADGGLKYVASKVLAERAAWNFMKSHELEFDLVHVMPDYVYGPMIHEVRFPASVPIPSYS